MKQNDAFTDKILDKLKYLNQVDVLKKEELTYLSIENINFAVLKDKKFLVKKTNRSKSMAPYALEVEVNGDIYLEINEYGNRVVVKELCQAIIKDLESI